MRIMPRRPDRIDYTIKGIAIALCLWPLAAPAQALGKAEIRAVIEAEYPGARVTEIEKERYRGQKIWEVDFRHEGRKLEAIIGLDGEIIKVQVDD